MIQKDKKSIPFYDKIGMHYTRMRKPDPRVQDAINAEVGTDEFLLNIGAGTGSYEPEGKHLIAVEPSDVMIRQRNKNSYPVIKATAEKLPFEDKAFDLAMAILSIHHWDNMELGLEEMKRVANRQLIFTWDPTHPGFWLTQDYFPEILSVDKSIFPDIEKIESIIGPMKKIPVPIPYDCQDGFGSAYWRRPAAYLLPAVRDSISTFHKIKETNKGIEKLRSDLNQGNWDMKYGNLLGLRELDLGFCVLSN